MARPYLDNRGQRFRLNGRLWGSFDTWVHIPNPRLTSNSKLNCQMLLHSKSKCREIFPLRKMCIVDENSVCLAWGQGVCNMKLRCITIIKQVFSGSRLIHFHGATNMLSWSKVLTFQKHLWIWWKMLSDTDEIDGSWSNRSRNLHQLFRPAATKTTVISGLRGGLRLRTLEQNTPVGGLLMRWPNGRNYDPHFFH